MKINADELEAFRLTLPEYKRDEKFQFGRTLFDVVLARFLIRQLGIGHGMLDVKAWCKHLGMDREFNPVAKSPTYGVCDLDVLWDDVDTTEPIIVLSIEAKRGRQFEWVIIDGNHRLRKAYLLDMPRIACYLILGEYRKLIKIK